MGRAYHLFMRARQLNSDNNPDNEEEKRNLYDGLAELAREIEDLSTRLHTVEVRISRLK